ncbi:unnamed protein product [Phytophthora fragariaefolia]|uniref:Unnamed protein product n=1 Tax=Phytophthora fragariaefolia TaxID=1490495 RepID=A0A9W6XXE6_9STRA|nr:unnamed protein product [Phytophthora fragariaefolia]
MARTRQQDAGEDWSCPLCTLLNSALDDRCQACDNARPPAHLLKKSQPPDPPVAGATASEAQRAYRPVSGVFFSRSVGPESDSSAASAWRQEMRLVVNRRRGNWSQKGATEREIERESDGRDRGTVERPVGSTATEGGDEQEISGADGGGDSWNAVEPMATAEKEVEKQEEEEEEETDMEPCFNLLGSGASVFAAPVVEEAVEERGLADERKSCEGGEVIVDDDDVQLVPAPQKYPGFMPASKVVIEELPIEEKLASAGLDLSESDDEEEMHKPRGGRKHDEKDDSWEDKWVCQICTNLNVQSAMECESCMVSRYRNAPSTPEMTTASDLKWACHICTNLNVPEATECDACYTNRRTTSQALNLVSDNMWRCHACSTRNAPGTARCEVCDRSRDEKSQEHAGNEVECPVCTNLNPPGSKECTICETLLQQGKASLLSVPVLFAGG